MSEEKVEIVRQPVTVRVHSRRRLVERLVLRLPRARRLLTRGVWRLRPGSGLRRWAVREGSRLAIEAANRHDYEAAFALIPPDYEAITPPDLVPLGFEPVYQGRDGRLRFQYAWVAELGDFQQETEEVIDLGDRVLLLGRMRGSGTASGAVFDSEIAYLLTVADGQLKREESFRSHQEALKAAGLSE